MAKFIYPSTPFGSPPNSRLIGYDQSGGDEPDEDGAITQEDGAILLQEDGFYLLQEG